MITIRASSLSSWFDCPRRSFARAYRDLVAAAGYELRHTMPSIGAAVGTGVHSSAHECLTPVIAGSAPAPLDRCVEAGIVSFRQEIARGAEFDNTTPTKNDAESQIQQIARSFFYQLAPSLRPKALECRRKASIEKDIILSGRCDLETVPGNIGDYKTGVIRRPGHCQYGGYSLLRRADPAINTPAGALKEFHLPRVPKTKPYPGPQIRDYPVEECERAAYTAIRHIIRDIRNWQARQDPQVLAANPMSVLCSPKYCSVYGTAFCEFGRRE